jgi:RNA recognition motif-containing protein
MLKGLTKIYFNVGDFKYKLQINVYVDDSNTRNLSISIKPKSHLATKQYFYHNNGRQCYYQIYDRGRLLEYGTSNKLQIGSRIQCYKDMKYYFVKHLLDVK